MLVDISFKRKFLPSNLYRYLPNITVAPDENLNVMGVVALTDLEDDTELFLDYWNVYAFDLKTVPDWMTIPPDNLGKLFVKRDYEHRVPLVVEIARELFVPEAVINRLDLNQIMRNEIKELMTPFLTEQKRLSDESARARELADEGAAEAKEGDREAGEKR